MKEQSRGPVQYHFQIKLSTSTFQNNTEITNHKNYCINKGLSNLAGSQPNYCGEPGVVKVHHIGYPCSFAILWRKWVFFESMAWSMDLENLTKYPWKGRVN